MEVEPQRSEGMKKVADLLKDLRVCMLVSQDDSGHLVGRPMSALHMDTDGSIRFFTNGTSSKTEQLDNINLTFINSADADYVSISGKGELEFDRAMIAALWTPAAEPWFPEGMDDPELAILRVDVKTAEVWDADNSTMIRIIAMAAAAVTGKPNATLQGEHALIHNDA